MHLLVRNGVPERERERERESNDIADHKMEFSLNCLVVHGNESEISRVTLFIDCQIVSVTRASLWRLICISPFTQLLPPLPFLLSRYLRQVNEAFIAN